MKTIKKLFIPIPAFFLACSLLASCQKPDLQKCDCWNPQWLIGTWEGVTPSAITPFENTKIRIVFREYHLGGGDTIEGSTQEIWAYDGTFTWDVDGKPWNMDFTASNYPQPDFNIIIWECVKMAQANQTMNNISLRISDFEQTDPFHVIDLDWGPVMNATGKAPTQIDFYGDIEITNGELYQRSEYPPVAGSYLRLKKK